jgi:Fe2+ or Zn2+ uptake regulation protein
MDHETAGEELRQAESRVARADRRVTNQRRLVARLEREGASTAEARKLLEQLEQARELNIADRDRLKREMA